MSILFIISVFKGGKKLFSFLRSLVKNFDDTVGIGDIIGNNQYFLCFDRIMITKLKQSFYVGLIHNFVFFMQHLNLILVQSFFCFIHLTKFFYPIIMVNIINILCLVFEFG